MLDAPPSLALPNFVSGIAVAHVVAEIRGVGVASIFISYGRTDRPTAERVRDWLEAKGYQSIFVDIDPELGITGGKAWEQELYAQLRSSTVVLFLATEASVASQWCFAEIALARAFGVPVIPLAVTAGCTHPLLDASQAIALPSGDRDDDLRLLRALQHAGVDGRAAIPWDARRSPYPGLHSFEFEDAGVFFGRDDKVDEMMRLLQPSLASRADRCIALIGPSGCGKSSLVRAGLIPRIRRSGVTWTVFGPMTPGTNPLRRLARLLSSELASSGLSNGRREIEQAITESPDELIDIFNDITADETKALLLVDQGEELVTITPNEQREKFLNFLGNSLSMAEQLR